MYDVTTGARLHDNTSSRQRQDSMNDRQLQQRNRSPSPAYQYTERDNTPQNYNLIYKRDSSSQRDNSQGGSRRDENQQYNLGEYNRSLSFQRDGIQQYYSGNYKRSS